MPFSKRTYEKGLLSANSGHSDKGSLTRKYLFIQFGPLLADTKRRVDGQFLCTGPDHTHSLCCVPNHDLEFGLWPLS